MGVVLVLLELYFPLVSAVLGGLPEMCLPSGMGVGWPHQDVEARASVVEWNEAIGATWWHDWWYGGGEGRAQMLWAVDAPSEREVVLGSWSTWKRRCSPVLVGNEPDGWGQDAVEWADAMWVMERQPVWWGCCGVIVNEGGMAWMDRYLGAGGPVPDVLLVHLYALWCPAGYECGDDVERLDALWGEFEGWVNRHPELDGVPVVVSEFGGSNSGQDEAVLDWGLRLLERGDGPAAIAWFSGRYLDGDEARYREQWLYGEDGQLTELGKHFRERMATR